MEKNLSSLSEQLDPNQGQSQTLDEVQEETKKEEEKKKKQNETEMCQLIYYDFSLKKVIN